MSDKDNNDGLDVWDVALGGLGAAGGAYVGARVGGRGQLKKWIEYQNLVKRMKRKGSGATAKERQAVRIARSEWENRLNAGTLGAVAGGTLGGGFGLTARDKNKREKSRK